MKEGPRPNERPGFLQDFSKSHLSDERKAAAKEIRDVRSENFAKKEREREIAETQAALTGLKVKLDGYDRFFKKVTDYKAYRKLNNQLAEKSADLAAAQSEHVPMQYKEPAKIVERFNEKIAKEWEKAPYNKEEAVKYFDVEHLAGLSESEYALLLKRFPSSMMTHVTRQGIRDHTGGVNHTAGQGKFWDGFEQIMRKRKLENQLSLSISDMHNKELITEFLGVKPHMPQEEALGILNQLTDLDKQHWHGSLADFVSVHTAVEEVADAHYGAESGNEMFFVFPSMYVASQKQFQGPLRSHEGGTHNNTWIFVDDAGLPVDAAMVFIPTDTPVSPSSGSKYELDASKQPIRNSEAQEKIRALLDNSDFLKFLEAATDVLGRRADEIAPASIEKIRLEGQSFVAGQPGLERLFDNFDSVLTLSVAARATDEHSKIDAIDRKLQSAGLTFKHAENPISSQEYWEEYFQKNPESRPARVVYYEGGDPTKALHQWKEKHGLSKHASDEAMGFSENSVALINDAKNMPNLQNQISRFRSLGEEAIEEFYRN